MTDVGFLRPLVARVFWVDDPVGF